MTPNERLALLADRLEANAANETGMKFDLALWLASNDKRPTQSCGTTGCAIGLACLQPEFNAEGFEAKPTHFGAVAKVGKQYIPTFGDYRQWPAIEQYFGIDASIAYNLFLEGHYSQDGLPTKGAESELAVAKRIREYLAKAA